MEKDELWDAQSLASLDEVDDGEHDDDLTIVLGRVFLALEHK